MAKWQITDWDLIDTNIADWVEIFWVTWSYSNMIVDPWLYYLWWPALSWDLWSWWWNNFRWDLKFYDDWTKIIIMGSSDVESNGSSFSQNWSAAYYAEIVKATWVLTVYPERAWWLWTTMSWWDNKLVYTSIWWTNRYWYTRTNLVWSTAYYYFNWTQVVQWWWTEIRAASNIWSSSISYRWRTLQKWTLFEMWDVLFYWAWWACLQTLQYG